MLSLCALKLVFCSTIVCFKYIVCSYKKELFIRLFALDHHSFLTTELSCSRLRFLSSSWALSGWRLWSNGCHKVAAPLRSKKLLPPLKCMNPQICSDFQNLTTSKLECSTENISSCESHLFM